MGQHTHLEVLQESLKTPSQLWGDEPPGELFWSEACSASFSVLYKIINWRGEREREGACEFAAHCLGINLEEDPVPALRTAQINQKTATAPQTLPKDLLYTQRKPEAKPRLTRRGDCGISGSTVASFMSLPREQWSLKNTCLSCGPQALKSLHGLNVINMAKNCESTWYLDI